MFKKALNKIINKKFLSSALLTVSWLSLFFSVSVFADSPAPLPKSSSASQLASVMGGLVFILLLIYGLSWFAKRFTQGGFLQNSPLKIVASLPLGTRERLVLVQVGQQQLLLGITATQINCLHTFNEPVVEVETASATGMSDFSQKLMAILNQKNLIDNKSNSKDIKE